MQPKLNQKEAGSSQKSCQTNQPQAGLSTVGRQILVGLLLSRRELAQRWNCCPHTIARRKDLQPVRLGRRLLRYRLCDVEIIEAAALGTVEGVK
ncbi:MAG TPA: hypothetical protein VMV89_03790 [Candidatus Paceibacterota bacterium]|nr:hypothetical protein [Candidatus Paceibacterota bacterium]